MQCGAAFPCLLVQIPTAGREEEERVRERGRGKRERIEEGREREREAERESVRGQITGAAGGHEQERVGPAQGTWPLVEG